MELKFNGAIHKKSEKDYSVSKFIKNIDIINDEEFILNIPSLDITLDQGNINSCVAHSLCVCNSILEYNHSNKWMNFNPHILYATRYLGHYTGQGMVPREAMDVLRKEGAFFRNDYDKPEEMPETQNSVQVFKSTHKSLCDNARNYSITGYMTVSTQYDIKHCLKRNIPVTAMWELYPSFYKVGSDGKVSIPDKTTEEYLGNHQMTIIGWTKESEWIVLNSWGSDHGFKGLYYIPFAYSPIEAYGVTDTIFPSKVKAKVIKLQINRNEMLVDDKTVELDSAPFIRNNRTLVPLRAISESLGAIVEWDSLKRTAIIDSEEGYLEFIADSNIACVNGRYIETDTDSQIVNCRMMVPIRIIAETLNCSVSWNHLDKTITIKSK